MHHLEPRDWLGTSRGGSFLEKSFAFFFVLCGFCAFVPFLLLLLLRGPLGGAAVLISAFLPFYFPSADHCFSSPLSPSRCQTRLQFFKTLTHSARSTSGGGARVHRTALLPPLSSLLRPPTIRLTVRWGILTRRKENKLLDSLTPLMSL